MANRIFTFFAAVALSVNSFGCTKSDTIERTEDILGTWSITGIQSDAAYDWDGNGTIETDILGTYSACERDIVLVFESGGIGRISEGCTSPYVNFTWQLSGNRLDVQIPSGDLNLDILSFSNNSLRGQDQVSVNGNNVRVTYTLTRRVRG
jgi:hypothetical protein